MQKHLGKNKKALSSLSLIILLLIAAIIGGIFSYLWVTGYYMSLKEKIPEQDMVAITNLSFSPQNATAFNVTLLNPSYSPSDKVEVVGIGYRGASENLEHFVQSSTPTLAAFNLSRGGSQTFMCIGNLTSYVNQTLWVSAFVVNGSGSTSYIKIPYTELLIRKIGFNSTIGVKNFTITLQNAPLSAANLTITEIRIDTQAAINTTLIKPTLPYTLAPNKTVTLSFNQSWSDYATSGGAHRISVLTKEGYSASNSTEVPKLAFSIQQISFNAADTTHFNVTVKNQVSTNTYLNVTRVQILLNNGTKMNVTTPLSPSTNGVLGNKTATIKCAWNWTNYRNKGIIATVYVLQGINATSSQQFTPPAGLLTISTTMPPVFPDTQHVLVTVQNSPYSTRPANITMIQIQLENGTLKTISGVNPSLPRLVEIGNTTMFNLPWNWANYLNKTIDIIFYTSEGYSTFKVVTTPPTTSNYQVYLSISTAIFNQTANFYVNVTNSASSVASANVTRITILLENGTEKDATLTTQMVSINSTATFTCGWDWSTYRNKSLVIRVYTNDGLKAIYVTKTPS